MLVTFSYLALALVSAYMLLAALKNELFPTATLLGGTNPHVSMITTYLLQAKRGSNEGSFLAQWRVWQQVDELVMVAGVACIVGNMLLGLRRPALRVVALLQLIYLLFLARGGVTFAYYVIPLIPLLTLNVALLAHYVISLVARLPWWINRAPARWMTPVVVLTAIALLLPYDLRMNHMTLLLGALKHAIPIKTFRNRLYWVTIYQLQHQNSQAGLGGPSLAPEMTLPIVNNGSTTLYVAEGYTGRLSTNSRTTVDESLAVHNASPFPATATITYLFEHGSPLVVMRTIGPVPHGASRSTPTSVPTRSPPQSCPRPRASRLSASCAARAHPV